MEIGLSDIKKHKTKTARKKAKKRSSSSKKKKAASKTKPWEEAASVKSALPKQNHPPKKTRNLEHSERTARASHSDNIDHSEKACHSEAKTEESASNQFNISIEDIINWSKSIKFTPELEIPIPDFLLTVKKK